MPARIMVKAAEGIERPYRPFYVVFMVADGLICGIGHTEEAAWAMAEAIEQPDEDDVIYDVKLCTRELLRLVMAEGGDVAYDDRHGTLVTEREAQPAAAALRPLG